MIIALLEAELRRDEGVRYSIYRDTAGIPTVGVGHNCQISPLPAGWVCPLTDDQVNQLMTNDITSTLAKLDFNLPWWSGLDEVRQRVIANMAFNMGISGLLTFRNTLTNIKLGYYTAAATGMRASLWARQVGVRSQRLAQAMETGVMPVADGIA
ncbi:lysozyme [Paraburkholderia bannensis]|uniref:Lysozyme n=1 Tax=Paraburkholderia bannensis TaxID=765414 RepID=A0A7W9WTF4_9BURK|nr:MULTISPECIES: glycoside hydrolase family protein [Paraburkholderia]MBB3258243.1 lysozyme [Paraburkholderia sp. WP4_3_2]MBB6103256.1 lysozyme [Paraburkholderia bannensis]